MTQNLTSILASNITSRILIVNKNPTMAGVFLYFQPIDFSCQQLKNGRMLSRRERNLLPLPTRENLIKSKEKLRKGDNTMRRKDREIKDTKKILEILEEAQVCRLGLYDEEAKEVYIVPLNYGWKWTETGNELTESGEPKGCLQLYFHGAKEGRKLELIEKAKETKGIGFEIETGFSLHTGEEACKHSAAFKSLIGCGSVALVTDSGEKTEALTSIMQHYTGKRWDFTAEQAAAVAVLRMTVAKISCKVHA